MDSLNQILFDDKSFSDLLKEIHGNQKKKAKQLASLIAELRPLVQSLGDATVVVPLIKEYMEISVKNDDQLIMEILTINGVRFSFKDGSWGLIRASSNKPSLVVVVESPTSDKRKKKIFNFIDDLLNKTGKIGEYDQKI